MAGSVNKVILIGNLGKDPEVRRLESGVAVASFPMATSESFNDRNTGERRTLTEWHNVVLWRGLAEIAEKYLRKGSSVYIEGKLRTRSWEDQDKNMRYTTEVIADNMTMLGGRPSEGAGGDQMNQNNSGGYQQQQPNTSSSSTQQATSQPDFSSPNDETDDLPF